MNRVPNCGFCGKSESDTGYVLQGMFDAFICADCIEQISLFPANTDALASCGFCGRSQKEVPKIMMGESAGICSICADTMLRPSVVTNNGFVINPRTRLGNWLLNSKSRVIKKYVLGIDR